MANLNWLQSQDTNWNDFYSGMTITDPFKDVVAKPKRIQLPNGQFVAPTGNTAVDALTHFLGPSPFAGPQETIDPDTLEPTGETTSAIDSFMGGFDFGSAVSRIAVIVLGFIFVAVGLSMFGAPVPIVKDLVK